MKRLTIVVLFLVFSVAFVLPANAEMAGFRKIHSNLGDAARSIAFKLDQNLKYRLNRSLPILKTSLVNIDDMKKTSTLGRYLGDQIGIEFAKYGYKVSELAIRKDSILIKNGQGEFALTRDVEEEVRDYEAQALIVGTYSQGKRYTDVSVRIVRTSDKSIISSCNTRIRKTPSIKGMLEETRYDDSGMKDSTVDDSETSNSDTNASETNQSGTNKSGQGGPYESGKVKLDKQSFIDTRIVQKRLHKLDYYHGCIDGVWGPKTQKALENFKQANNISNPEEWNLKTQKRLFSLP